MSSDWQSVFLSEIANYSQGIQVIPEDQFLEPTSDSGRFVRIIDYTNPSEPVRYIKNPGARYSVTPDDIVMIRYGSQTAGKVVRGISGFIANNLFKVNLKTSEVDAGFLYRILDSKKVFDYLRGSQSSSTMPAITFGMMDRIELRYPSISEQRTISAFFDSLDDRIALLRETNATLEAIAQALFKSWFVDFDPVHANAGTQAPSLPSEIQALFPATFTDSPQGPIPEGWSTCPLDGAAHFLNGLALQKFPPTGDEFLPVIKIAQLRKGDTSGADRANRDLKPEYIIQNGDVLFSWSGSLEVAIWFGGEGALNQHLFKVTSDKFPKWFYFLWTKYHLPNFQQIAASKATTMGHIQRKHLTEASVMIPPDNVLSAANEVFAPLIEDFINNSLQASNLAALRDALLPRLISGQLRLPEAEQAIAAITD